MDIKASTKFSDRDSEELVVSELELFSKLQSRRKIITMRDL